MKRIKRIAAICVSFLLVVGISSSGWLMSFCKLSHQKSEDGSLTISEQSQLVADTVSNERGMIYDIKGVVLAENIPAPEKPAEPVKKEEYKKDDKKQDKENKKPWYEGDSVLGAFLGFLSEEEEKTEEISEEEETAAQAAKGETIRHVPEPYDVVLAPYLGYYNKDGRMDGIERRLNTALINGNFASENADAYQGNHVVTTLDAELCRFAYDQMIQKGIRKGAAVMVDVESGAVRMAVSLSRDEDGNSYSLNAFNEGNQKAIASYKVIDESYYNQCTVSRNLGSTCKPLSDVAIVRSGIDPTFVEQNGLLIGGVSIKNSYGSAHDGEVLDMNEGAYISSNTYHAAKLVEAGSDMADAMSYSFMLDSEDIIETDFGTVKSTYEHTNDAELALCAFGQGGFTVSAVQLACAYAAIANPYGDFMKPYMISHQIAPDGSEVDVTKPEILRECAVSAEEREKVGAALRRAGERYPALNPDGCDDYFICGKSGTAQIILSKNDGSTQKGVNCVFAGYFPEDAPRYAMVMVAADDPVTSHSGGATFAGIFRAVADKAMNE